MSDYETTETTTPHTTTTIVERRGGGGTALLAVILLIVAGIAAYMIFAKPGSSEARKDDAIAGAAKSVGTAADKIGDAVTPDQK